MLGKKDVILLDYILCSINLNQMSNCPCGSGKSYVDCCESIIKNQSATTALSLMRSRYTAYCNCDVDYLLNTVKWENRKQYNRSEIAQWSKENTWTKLEIIRFEKGEINDTNGIVEFKAFYNDAKGLEHIHHEISTFSKDNGSWFYVDGKFVSQKTNSTQNVDRNSPCPCGSGKKYKKCCM